MSLIHAVLLSGKFRSFADLGGMNPDDQRNTLIVELANRTNQSRGPSSPSPIRRFQAMDELALGSLGAVYVFLRQAHIRSEADLQVMSDDDMRNTLIVEIEAQTRMSVAALQGLSNLDLVLRGLGWGPFGGGFRVPSYIRGVLLAGGFRTHHELNRMSAEDMRNTLIVELQQHSHQTDGQTLSDHALAGAAAVMVFLKETGGRDVPALRRMTVDDQRNTLIVGVEDHAHLGIPRLQGFGNLDLVRLALGLEPQDVVEPARPPLHPPASRLQFRLRGFSEHEATDEGAQGVTDEVYLSALGGDSATAHWSDGKIVTERVEAPTLGDITEDSVRGPWAENPHVLMEFDLTRDGHWPRTYFVTLLLVEHDNQDLGEAFAKVKQAVGKEMREAVTAAAIASGAAAGTAILPGIGTAVGAAAGALAGLAWDHVISEIGNGLANEVFSPQTIQLMLDPNAGVPPEIDRPSVLRVEEHDAVYDVAYDWHIQADNA